jgi:hypothetical protein
LQDSRGIIIGIRQTGDIADDLSALHSCRDAASKAPKPPIGYAGGHACRGLANLFLSLPVVPGNPEAT